MKAAIITGELARFVGMEEGNSAVFKSEKSMQPASSLKSLLEAAPPCGSRNRTGRLSLPKETHLYLWTQHRRPPKPLKNIYSSVKTCRQNRWITLRRNSPEPLKNTCSTAQTYI